MSRQMVMNRKGSPLGFIDTDYDGTQNAYCTKGTVIAQFDPRTNQTLDPAGRTLADGNALPSLMRRLG